MSASCPHPGFPFKFIRTFVALGHRGSAGTVGILGRFPEPGTSGRLHLGSRRMELDH